MSPTKERAAELDLAVEDQWLSAQPRPLDLRSVSECDRLGDVATISWESSMGYAGVLMLAELRHRADGDWELATIEFNARASANHSGGRSDPWATALGGVPRLRAGVISGDVADPAIERLRDALALRIDEPLAAPDEGPPPATLGTTHEFHVALRLVDAQGYGVDRFFAGFETSDADQSDRVALDLADTELWILLEEESVEAALIDTVAVDPAIAALFDGRFAHARTRGADFGYPYLGERMLALTRSLGRDAHVPELLAQIDATGAIGHAVHDPDDLRGQKLGARTRAINAIAKITGFDDRYDARGRPRAVDMVAHDVLAACR